MLAVKHATQVSGTDNPAHPVSASAWNGGHVLTGTAGMLVGFDGQGAGTEIDPATLAVIPAASRSALAALTGHVTPRILTESGREGTFVWSSANLSTLVAADTAQGICVAPASDTSGASGAWVRKFNGYINAQWFGLVSDDLSQTGSNQGATMAAIMSAILALRVTTNIGYGGAASPTLFIPSGAYYLGTTAIDIVIAMGLYGEGSGLASSGATVLRWADGTCGIRVQNYNTTGTTGTTAGAQVYRGSGARIRGFYLRGGYAGTESDSYGILFRAPALAEDVFCDNFPGDGFATIASVGGVTASLGNANGVQLIRCFAQKNRAGFYWKGSDANAGVIIGCNAAANRTYGFDDESDLGNYFFGCQSAANGWDGASIPTGCTLNGHRYYLKAGQAANASATAPNGDLTSNSVWGYKGEGGVYNGVPTWVSGTTFREGGGYRAPGANQTGGFTLCYQEPDQNPAQINAPNIVTGGQLATINVGTAGGPRTDTSGYQQFGFSLSGFSRDGFIAINNTNVTSGIKFNRYTAPGVFTQDALIETASGQLILDHTAKINFRLNAVSTLTLNSSGLLMVAATGIGYGTGAGGAITQSTSRTTTVPLNNPCGAITLFSAAGSPSWQSFTVTNSVVAAGDVIHVSQKSGADKYMIHVTKVQAGLFEITYATTGGTTTEQPAFNFAIVKATNS